VADKMKMPLRTGTALRALANAKINATVDGARQKGDGGVARSLQM